MLFLAWILLELVRDSRALFITLKNNIWYEPNLRQVTYVEELGADYLAIRKDRVFPKMVETLRKLDRPILFENDRIIVLKANPQPQPLL